MLEKTRFGFTLRSIMGVMLIFVFVVTFGFAAPADAAKGGKPKGGANDWSYEGGDEGVIGKLTVEVCGVEGTDVVCHIYDTNIKGRWLNSWSHNSFPAHMCDMYFPDWDIGQSWERKNDNKNSLIHIYCDLKKKFRHSQTEPHHEDDNDDDNHPLWREWCLMHDEDLGVDGFGEPIVQNFYHHDLFDLVDEQGEQENSHEDAGPSVDLRIAAKHFDYDFCTPIIPDPELI